MCKESNWDFTITVTKDGSPVSANFIALKADFTLEIESNNLDDVGVYSLEVRASHKDAERVGNPSDIVQTIEISIEACDASEFEASFPSTE